MSDVIIYGNGLGYACSACAPKGWTAEQIEQEAIKLAKPVRGIWKVKDVAMIRRGPSSPNPCERDPDRLHWFLVAQP